ncbi:MAG: tRNA pseudouridine(38-40) synthase TruA [bacterium]
MNIRSYKMTVSYVGTEYCGWQVQPSFKTIQGTIEDLLSKVFNKKIVLRYASRTDSGVHALAQIACFSCRSDYKAVEIQKMLNTQLPQDIVIKNVEEVSEDFNPRKANKKTYFYLIDNNAVRNPFRINRVWWVKYKINKEKMLESLEYFKGKQDFRSFMASGSSAKTTIREIYEISMVDRGDIIKISFTGSGFLKQMIRNIIGTVVEVGRGRFEPKDIKVMLASKDRKTAGITAPAYGLYLERIYYD